ncbi:hypothetical protein KCU78_g518, partial [Aureobasidium melanogenum]
LRRRARQSSPSPLSLPPSLLLVPPSSIILLPVVNIPTVDPQSSAGVAVHAAPEEVSNLNSSDLNSSDLNSSNLFSSQEHSKPTNPPTIAPLPLRSVPRRCLLRSFHRSPDRATRPTTSSANI